MQGIVPGDVLIAGVGHHADLPPCRPLPPDHIGNARERIGNMGLDVFLPAHVLVQDLLLRKMKALAAEIRKADPVAFPGVLLCGGRLSGPECVQDLQKIGKIHGHFTLDHRIIMVQHQAGKTHGGTSVSLLSYYSKGPQGLQSKNFRCNIRTFVL